MGAAAPSSGRPSTSLRTSGNDVEAAVGEGLSLAEASTTTVRTVITGPSGESSSERADEAAALLDRFEGGALDARAEAEIAAALEACAARARALDAAYDIPGEGAADAAEGDPGQS